MNVRPGLQMYKFRVDLVGVNRSDISEQIKPIIFHMVFQASVVFGLIGIGIGIDRKSESEYVIWIVP